MRVGSKVYSGDGVDDRTITHDIATALQNVALAIIGRFDATGTHHFRFPSHPAGYDSPFTGAGLADAIQAFLTNGSTQDVQVGTLAVVNAATGTYQMVTFLIDGSVIVSGTYVGTGLDNRAVTGLGFQPDFVLVKNYSSADVAVARQSTMGAGQSIDFNGSATLTDGIKSLDADGFTVGTNVRVNTVVETYYYFAFKAKAGNVALFSYTGDGVDDRNVAHGLGSTPKCVIILPIQTSSPCWRPGSITDDTTMFFFGTAPSANRIQSMDGTNVNLGTGASVNTSGRAYHGIAFGDAPDPVSGGGQRLSLLGVGS